MIPIPIDQIFALGKYLAVVLLLCSPALSFIYSWIMKQVDDTRTPPNPLLLGLRLLFASILFAIFIYYSGITGQISLKCKLEPHLSCQRERTFIYGLFKQNQTLTALNPIKEDKMFPIGEESDTQLVLEDKGHRYLLSPSHPYAELEQINGEEHQTKSIDTAIKDIQAFKQGQLGNFIYYRDHASFLGSLVTIIQFILGLPTILTIWILFQYCFSTLISKRNS